MNWFASIFIYCERGTDPSFWAEPLNAISNAAFFAAAFLAAQRYRNSDAPRDWAIIVLIALTVLVGTGSFAFHTLATRASAIADIVPIAIFMIAYVTFALRRFAAAPWWATILMLASFIAALALADRLPCPGGLLPITAAGQHPCLNGSLRYLPAFIALAGMAGYLAAKEHPAAGYLAKATLIFAVSLTFRTIDFEVCDASSLLGRPRGTHALWHGLNGLMFYALLRAAVDSRAR